ncbi:MAG TPA: HAD family hydrolase [Gemmatimonadales bacterium]
MRYRLLACDYDGTVATQGRMDAPTGVALERLRASGYSLVLVTGRQVNDLCRVCRRLDLFDRVVAENGALLYRPRDRSERVLGQPPPPSLIEELDSRGIAPLSVGRVIVATWEPHQSAVRETIEKLGLDLQLSFNKGAIMVLPSGIDKASGLGAALDELRVPAGEAVGIGDAENDRSFLDLCGYSVAVANALPELKERVDYQTKAEHGAGVVEVIERLLGPGGLNPGRGPA